MAGSCWGSCWRATAILCIIRLRFAIVVGFANALRAGLSATHVQLAREWVCCKCAVGSGTRRRKARSAQKEALTTQPPADNDCEVNAAPSGPQALHTRGGSLLLCSDCVTQKNLVTTMCAFVLFFVLKYQLRNCAPVMLQKGTAAYSLQIGKNVKQHAVASTAVRIARWLRITQEVRQTLLTRPAAAGPSTCGSPGCRCTLRPSTARHRPDR